MRHEGASYSNLAETRLSRDPHGRFYRLYSNGYIQLIRVTVGVARVGPRQPLQLRANATIVSFDLMCLMCLLLNHCCTWPLLCVVVSPLTLTVRLKSFD